MMSKQEPKFLGAGGIHQLSQSGIELPQSGNLKNDLNTFMILDTFADCFASILAM